MTRLDWEKAGVKKMARRVAVKLMFMEVDGIILRAKVVFWEIREGME